MIERGRRAAKVVEADVKLQFGFFFGNTTPGTMEQGGASTAGAGKVTSAGLGQGRAAEGPDSGPGRNSTATCAAGKEPGAATDRVPSAAPKPALSRMAKSRLANSQEIP